MEFVYSNLFLFSIYQVWKIPNISYALQIVAMENWNYMKEQIIRMVACAVKETGGIYTDANHVE